MKRSARTAFAAALILLAGSSLVAAPPNVSRASRVCLTCHENLTPGIVANWQLSKHATTTVLAALKKPAVERAISAQRETVPTTTTVGCAECHTINAEKRPDTFDHFGNRVHVVVTPADCAACHPAERDQFNENLMAHARGNLVDNPLLSQLKLASNTVPGSEHGSRVTTATVLRTEADTCLACHGTKVEIRGMRERQTPIGAIPFQIISGWPNQGVGRANPDGSLGACTACHARHQFSVRVARSPDTCRQCHEGKDVPAYGVYELSKHGAIHRAATPAPNLDSIPWVLGTDFRAPTCATCHMSLVVTPTRATVVERSHRMNDRLPWRLFGLPYAHAHPRSASTHTIRCRSGLSLPTDLDGAPATEHLIDSEEFGARLAKMKRVCNACHATGWIDEHFGRLEESVLSTNAATLAATKAIQEAWSQRLATGLEHGGSPFDEPLERMWVESWLFYANSTRLATAMSGADRGSFTDGRWQLMRTIGEMSERLRRPTKH